MVRCSAVEEQMLHEKLNFQDTLQKAREEAAQSELKFRTQMNDLEALLEKTRLVSRCVQLIVRLKISP